MKDKTKPPSEQADKFMLRLPEGMREIIRDRATHSGRSMNAEIVFRLTESLLATDASDEVIRKLPDFDEAYPDDIDETLKPIRDSMRNPDFGLSDPVSGIRTAAKFLHLLNEKERALRRFLEKARGYAVQLEKHRLSASAKIIFLSKKIDGGDDD